MRKAILILMLPFFTACNNSGEQVSSVKWNEGYDPKHPECFDTIICANGDSLLIINMAIDSIL